MTEWSDYFQNPAFLESSRMFMLDTELRELCIRWIGIKEYNRILDVGCGTGKFTEYLAQGVRNCYFAGIDNDRNLLAYAQNHKAESKGNTFSFLEGDALHMPFPDNHFDVTVSHTFLTNISNVHKALQEMKRVTKTGGVVASVTAQDFSAIPCYPGYYPEKYRKMLENYYQLYQQMHKAYEEIKPFSSFIAGADTREVPHLFAAAGFWNIRMYGLGRAFSLSDTRYSNEQKQHYIECQYLAETEKLGQYELLPEFREILTETICQNYRNVLIAYRDMLLEMIERNTAWEWYGGSSLLMVGTVPADLSALQKLFPKKELS